ncbi:CBS domain-containing protein [bacterium]|nr:CBS domain-containing protein [bacterium]
MAEVYDLEDEMTQMEEDRVEAEIAAKDFNSPLSLLEPPDPVCVESGSSLKQAIDKLVENKVGCVLITKSKKLIGMITERHILQTIAHRALDLDREKIDDHMVTQPKVLKMSDPILDALRFFITENIRHIPIVNDRHEPVGYTSVRGMINYIVSFFTEDVINLPPNPLRFGASQADGA